MKFINHFKKFVKEKNHKIFIYFAIVAPILSKIIEWLIGIINGSTTYLYQQFGIGIFFEQLFFIVTLAMIIYSVVFIIFDVKKNISSLALVPATAYFIKELYNLIFVTHSLNYGTVLSLTVEPLFVYVIMGVIGIFLFKKRLK